MSRFACLPILTRHRIAASLLLLSLPAAVTATPPAAPTAPRNATDWANDLALFQRELPTRHKDLFFSVDRATFDRSLDALRADLPQLDTLQTALRLHEIVIAQGDDHSGVRWDRLLANEAMAPFGVRWFSDGWRILSIDRHRADLLGQKLVAIGGVPMDEVERRFARILSRDNPWLVKHRMPNVLGFAGVLGHLGLATTNGVTLTTIAEGGTPHQTTLAFSSTPSRPQADMVQFRPAAVPYAWAHPRSLLRFKMEDGIFYILYNRCEGRETAERSGDTAGAAKLPSLAEYFEKTAAALQTALADGKVEKVVFDVQFNPGGASDFGTHFAEVLARLPLLHEPDRVYVIVGRRTFSSAIINAMDFKRLLGATVVGEPTSGTPNHFGEVREFTLPSSGLHISYSTRRFGAPGGAFEPLRPDLPVELSFADFAAGRDPVLEVIRRQPVGRPR